MFEKIIVELLNSGLSEKEIACRIGMTQPSVNRIKLGKQQMSNLAAADALRALHRERVTGGAAS